MHLPMPPYAVTAKLADLIEARAVSLAERVVAAQLATDSEIATRYGTRERRKSVEDATHTLRELAEAVANDDPAAFLRYIAWLEGILLRVGLPRSDLARHLVLLREHILGELPAEFSGLLRRFLDAAVHLVMPDEESRE